MCFTPCPIAGVAASAYRIPTDAPEADGTFAWDATTMVLAEVAAADHVGIGYTYADATAAELVRGPLAAAVSGRDAMDVPACWEAMRGAVRNLGRPGIASTAISAVDAALWDLKAKLLGVSLADLLGLARDGIPSYGSGGFTSYSVDELGRRLAGWAEQGFAMVKMKVGADPAADLDRVRAAREAIGPGVALFVDANGAFDRKQALRFAGDFAELGVTWFEEPVSSDDLDGLRLLRDRAPAGMEIASGEYGYDDLDFRLLLEGGAVDVLMPDATRCLGITGFSHAAALAAAHKVPVSAHCAPALSLAPCCALPGVRHLEYFHDHARIEAMLLDGAPRPDRGILRPDRSRPGLGLEFKRADASAFAL